MRETDLLCRYGGDEFVVLMPNTGYAGAVLLADRLGKLVRTQDFSFEKFSMKVTISIGVFSYPDDPAANDTELTKCADEALYLSKQGGKDKYSCFKDKKPEV